MDGACPTSLLIPMSLPLPQATEMERLFPDAPDSHLSWGQYPMASSQRGRDLSGMFSASLTRLSPSARAITPPGLSEGIARPTPYLLLALYQVPTLRNPIVTVLISFLRVLWSLIFFQEKIRFQHTLYRSDIRHFHEKCLLHQK
jgi:hypothetical protein